MEKDAHLSKAKDILNFWFGDLSQIHSIQNRISERSKFWYQKNEQNDELIRKRFLSTHEAAEKGNLNHWLNSPDGSLALILVLDQFSRNIFRNMPKSYASDKLTNKIVHESFEKNFPEKFHPVLRTFFLVPLMHMEDMENQNLCVKLTEELCIESQKQELPGEIQKFLTSTWQYALKHREVIENFGRFPHRNRILERESTYAELQYLKKPGSGF